MVTKQAPGVEITELKSNVTVVRSKVGALTSNKQTNNQVAVYTQSQNIILVFFGDNNYKQYGRMSRPCRMAPLSTK